MVGRIKQKRVKTAIAKNLKLVSTWSQHSIVQSILKNDFWDESGRTRRSLGYVALRRLSLKAERLGVVDNLEGAQREWLAQAGHGIQFLVCQNERLGLDVHVAEIRLELLHHRLDLVRGPTDLLPEEENEHRLNTKSEEKDETQKVQQVAISC